MSGTVLDALGGMNRQTHSLRTKDHSARENGVRPPMGAWFFVVEPRVNGRFIPMGTFGQPGREGI